MLKQLVLASALMFCLPTASHAFAKRPAPGTMPGGANRPVATPTPKPLSQDCIAGKALATQLRDSALGSLNAAVKQSKPSPIDINYYNCRLTYAQEAVSVAEISVCGGYLKSGEMQNQLGRNFKICEEKRAAEKLALSQGAQPPKVSQTLPPQPAAHVPAAGGGGGQGGRAAGSQSVK